MLRAVANQSAYVGSFTYATLPAAASFSGMEAFASDWGANGTRVRSNGTRWLPVNGQTTLKHLGAAVTGINATPTIFLQSLIPIGALQVNDQIIVYGDGVTKSGTTDAGVATVYLGTAGTTADAAVLSSANTCMTAASQTGSFMYGFKVTSTTGIVRIGPILGSGGTYGAQSSTAAGAATTVSDISANALYISAGLASGGATNTVGAQDARIIHIAG